MHISWGVLYLDRLDLSDGGSVPTPPGFVCLPAGYQGKHTRPRHQLGHRTSCPELHSNRTHRGIQGQEDMHLTKDGKWFNTEKIIMKWQTKQKPSCINWKLSCCGVNYVASGGTSACANSDDKDVTMMPLGFRCRSFNTTLALIYGLGKKYYIPQ